MERIQNDSEATNFLTRQRSDIKGVGKKAGKLSSSEIDKTALEWKTPQLQ